LASLAAAVCARVRRCSDRGGSLDQESFLDRIERLAYADKRRLDASRSALADHVHNSECTFRPAINRRSARMVRVSVCARRAGGEGWGRGLHLIGCQSQYTDVGDALEGLPGQ
jgi:hypothetical protein